MLQITIKGNVPPKKNSKRIFKNYYSGRMTVLPSEKHQDWYNTAYYEAKKQLNKHAVANIGGRAEVTMYFTFSDKRKRDLSNAAESVMDLLVDIGALTDDNVFEVPKLTLIYSGQLKENPCVTVDIFYLTNKK